MAETELNRREFVIFAGNAMVAACAGCASNAGAPTGPQEKVAVSPAKIVDVGTPADFPATGVSDRFVKSNRILLVQEGGQLFALEGTCTHKNCALKAFDKEILCPCHGSRFDLAGKVLHGPADEPLEHYSISLQGGRIMVDKTKTPAGNDPDLAVKVG